MAGKRKIVQITSAGEDGASLLFALCDDGTLWCGQWDSDAYAWFWSSVSDVPQGRP
jgi:hypothetical protein